MPVDTIDMTNPLERAAYKAFGRVMSAKNENTPDYARNVAKANYLIDEAIRAERGAASRRIYSATPAPRS